MELASPGIIYTIIMFLLLLTVLVAVHEWGHFAVARYFGVKVDVFSIGFGRELFGWTDSKGTRWKLSMIPLGGYVKFHGDAGESSNADNEAIAAMSDEERAYTFQCKPVHQRAAIAAAGPLVNFIFAILVFSGLYMSLGEPYSPSVISAVAEGSAAEQAGILPGDRIVEINGQEVSRFDDLQSAVRLYTSGSIALSVERDGRIQHLDLVPRKMIMTDRFGNSYDVYRIGVSSGPVEMDDLGVVASIARAVERTGELTKMMLVTTGQVISGVRSVDEMGGPIRIAQFSGQQAALGLVSFISFMALISINLGLVNLFPIPMLDGGHLLFYAMEAIKGSPVSEKVQEFSYLAGMALVLGLMVFLTWNDLSNFDIWERLGRFLNQ